MIPFAKVTRDDLAAISRLPRPQLVTWLALRLLGANDWAIRRRDVEAVTGLSARHVKLAFAGLERSGFLTRTYCGDRKDPWGRLRVRTGIPKIPVEGSPGSLSRPEEGSPRSLYTIQDLDRSISDPSLPRDLSGSAGGDAGREGGGEVPGELERVARELWPNVASAPARRYLAQLCELAPGVPAAELAAYLRHVATDPTLERAALPLAAACTADRLAPWLRRRRRPKRAERSSDSADRLTESAERLTPAEVARLADALRALK